MLMYMAWRLGQCIGSSFAVSILFIFLVGFRYRLVQELCIRGWSRCNISCYLHGVLYLLELISAVGTACTVSALPPIKIPIDSGYVSL